MIFLNFNLTCTSGRVWRTVPESEAWSVGRLMTSVCFDPTTREWKRKQLALNDSALQEAVRSYCVTYIATTFLQSGFVAGRRG